MKPEVVLFLVVFLLPLQNLALFGDAAAASSMTRSQTDEHGTVANTAGGKKILHPVEKKFEARRKRSLADNDERQTSKTAGSNKRQVRDVSMPQSDDGHLTEPKVHDIGDADKSWNDHVSELNFPRHVMAWIRRRSPESSGSLDAVFRPPGIQMQCFDHPVVVAVGRRTEWSGSNEGEMTTTATKPRTSRSSAAGRRQGLRG